MKIKKQIRLSQIKFNQILFGVIIWGFALLTCSCSMSIYCTEVQSSSWLTPGVWAQYTTIGPAGIWFYNASLTPENGSIALENLNFIESLTIDKEVGDEFTYRWEVTSIDDPIVTLKIFVGITDWGYQWFNCSVDLNSNEAYVNNSYIGITYFWLTSTEYEEIDIISSNPVLSFSKTSHALQTRTSVQGIQEVIAITGQNQSYDYHTSLTFDESTGILLTLNRRTILPFPLESRFINFISTIELEHTNIDLGPDILLPDFGGMLAVGGIIVGIIVLTGIFYIARRSQFQTRRKRIKKKK
ncbi:MAG: hypothetical protein ACFFCH_06300 [Promethearchaeota archaeon]